MRLGFGVISTWERLEQWTGNDVDSRGILGQSLVSLVWMYLIVGPKSRRQIEIVKKILRKLRKRSAGQSGFFHE